MLSTVRISISVTLIRQSGAPARLRPALAKLDQPIAISQCRAPTIQAAVSSNGKSDLTSNLEVKVGGVSGGIRSPSSSAYYFRSRRDAKNSLRIEVLTFLLPRP